MGVDGIKPKVATTVPQTVAPKELAPAKLQEAFEPIKKKAEEGFDTLKKKLVSVTGGFKAHKPMIPDRDDLKAEITGRRSSLAANGGTGPLAGATKTDVGEGDTLKDASFDTASSKGADPAARAPASDFAAEAAKTPGIKKENIDGVANAKARAALEKDFGVKVKDGDKKWSTEELSRAHESFGMMPKGDQEKLKGLDLIRNAKASPESQAEMGTKGTVAGEYSPNVSTTDGKRDKPGSISLYDASFPAGKTSRKESIHTILHEAGHAVEGRARNDATAARNETVDVLNASVAKAKPLSDANNTQWTDTNKASKSFGSVDGKDKPGMAFVGAQNKVATALDKLQKATTPADVAKAQTELDAAKAKRDTAMAGMSGHKKESGATTWVAATDAQERSARAFADQNTISTTARADVADKTKASAALGTNTNSKELQAFTTARGKEKQVSGYGASKGAEGYAEAYALYQRDPATMKKDFPKQYAFFHKNHPSGID